MISKQQQWKAKQRALDRCTNCAKPSGFYALCEECRARGNERAKKWYSKHSRKGVKR